jgi:hypothetical protein
MQRHVTAVARTFACLAIGAAASPAASYADQYAYTFTGEGGSGSALTFKGTSASSGTIYTGSVTGTFIYDTTTNTFVSTSGVNVSVTAGTSTVVWNASPACAEVVDPNTIRFGTAPVGDNPAGGCPGGANSQLVQLSFNTPSLATAPLGFYIDANGDFYCEQSTSGSGNNFCATSSRTPFTSISGGLIGVLVPAPFSILGLAPLGLALRLRKRYKPADSRPSLPA